MVCESPEEIGMESGKSVMMWLKVLCSFSLSSITTLVSNTKVVTLVSKCLFLLRLL